MKYFDYSGLLLKTRPEPVVRHFPLSKSQKASVLSKKLSKLNQISSCFYLFDCLNLFAYMFKRFVCFEQKYTKILPAKKNCVRDLWIFTSLKLIVEINDTYLDTFLAIRKTGISAWSSLTFTYRLRWLNLMWSIRSNNCWPSSSEFSNVSNSSSTSIPLSSLE